MTQRELFEIAEPRIGEIETWSIAQGHTCIVGVDEAGRGPLAGPVYAAAVVLELGSMDAAWLSGLDDSKKLTAARREAYFDQIVEHAVAYAITCSDSATVDEINILQATFRAMERAVEEACEALDSTPDCVFVDGNMTTTLEVPQRAIVKGDSRSIHIAAASILAKVARDRVMLEHHETWPEYGFDSNKGYGSAKHREAIARVGPCPIHRLSFGGVQEYAHLLRT